MCSRYLFYIIQSVLCAGCLQPLSANWEGEEVYSDQEIAGYANQLFAQLFRYQELEKADQLLQKMKACAAPIYWKRVLCMIEVDVCLQKWQVDLEKGHQDQQYALQAEKLLDQLDEKSEEAEVLAREKTFDRYYNQKLVELESGYRALLDGKIAWLNARSKGYLNQDVEKQYADAIDKSQQAMVHCYDSFWELVKQRGLHPAGKYIRGQRSELSKFLIFRLRDLVYLQAALLSFESKQAVTLKQFPLETDARAFSEMGEQIHTMRKQFPVYRLKFALETTYHLALCKTYLRGVLSEANPPADWSRHFYEEAYHLAKETKQDMYSASLKNQVEGLLAQALVDETPHQARILFNRYFKESGRLGYAAKQRFLQKKIIYKRLVDAFLKHNWLKEASEVAHYFWEEESARYFALSPAEKNKIALKLAHAYEQSAREDAAKAKSMLFWTHKAQAAKDRHLPLDQQEVQRLFGAAYFLQKNWERSEQAYLKALALLQAHQEGPDRFKALGNIFEKLRDIADQNNAYEKSIAYAQQASDAYRKSDQSGADLLSQYQNQIKLVELFLKKADTHSDGTVDSCCEDHQKARAHSQQALLLAKKISPEQTQIAEEQIANLFASENA